MASMTAPLTLAEAHVRGLALVSQHTERFTRFLAGLDEKDLSAPVPGLDWTVGETITHVHSVYLRYTTDLRRAESPEQVGEHNAEDIARLGVDVSAAAAAMTEQVAVLESILPHVRPDQTFPFHAGQQTTLAGGWGNLLGELLAHGDDVARATGSTFGIPGDDLEILWRFGAPLLQGWLTDATISDAWLLRFPFGNVGVVFDNGRLGWDETVAHPEHIVDIDDVAEWTLAFPYRRRAAPDEQTSMLLERFQSL